jgi:hypothetical protein
MMPMYEYLLAPSYSLVDRNRCVDENVVFVCYARLLLLIFTRRQFKILNLCLLGLAAEFMPHGSMLPLSKAVRR